MGSVSVQTVSNRCSIVTICKYETYQGMDSPDCPARVPQVSSTCPAGVQHVSTIEEGKERKEGKKVKKKPKRFVEPTLEDVGQYCIERENAISPQEFLDYYESRGWKYKTGQPMVDWKAAVRTWENNRAAKSNQTSGFTLAERHKELFGDDL